LTYSGEVRRPAFERWRCFRLRACSV